MRKLSIAMYHYTRDLKNSRYPNIKGLDYKLFEEQLIFFSKNYNVVTMEDVLDAVTNKAPLPPNPLLLTFDDGYIDNYLVALPLLKKYKMQGSFFIPGKTFSENILLDVNKIHFILAASNEAELFDDVKKELDYYRGVEWDYPNNDELFSQYGHASRFDTPRTVFIKKLLQVVLPEELRKTITSKLFTKYIGIDEEIFAHELYMNHDQIMVMKNEGMYIGLHGYDHYWLTNLTPEALSADIDKSLMVMQDFINPECWVMNYPYGDYNDSVIDYLKQKGCKLAMTTNVNIANLDNDSPFMLPRLDCNDFPPKSSNYTNY